MDNVRHIGKEELPKKGDAHPTAPARCDTDPDVGTMGLPLMGEEVRHLPHPYETPLRWAAGEDRTTCRFPDPDRLAWRCHHRYGRQRCTRVSGR